MLWDTVDVGVSKYKDGFATFEGPVLNFPTGSGKMAVGFLNGYLDGRSGSRMGGGESRSRLIYGFGFVLNRARIGVGGMRM